MAVVTYACVDCGKERTSERSSFSENVRSGADYRCRDCAPIYYKKESTQTVTYACIDCGEERTDYISRFKQDEENHRCHDCAMSHRAKDPVWIERFKTIMENVVKDPSHKESMRQGAISRSNNPTWLNNVKMAGKKRSEDPAWVENNKKLFTDPTWIKNNRDSISESRLSKPEWAESVRTSALNNFQNESYVENRLVGIFGQGFWYGHPILKEKRQIKYCELWNRDLWNRIDAAWDFESSISRKTRFENREQQQLSRHHVYWQEKACCEWDEDSKGYYAMINVGTFFNPVMYRHDIKGDPNKFVLLTASEHGMIKGSKKLGTNILTWIIYFENLINTREKEGKKCYLSKEDYEIYKRENKDKIKNFSQKIKGF